MVYHTSPSPPVIEVQSRFAETLTLTLTLNPNFGESGFGESGRHRNRMLKKTSVEEAH